MKVKALAALALASLVLCGCTETKKDHRVPWDESTSSIVVDSEGSSDTSDLGALSISEGDVSEIYEVLASKVTSAE